jgi:4-nitrophenyl phosphatase
MTWLLDCDGVVWLSEQVIPGAPQAVANLRDSGSRVVLLTNNSYPRLSDHVAKLERLGMPTDPGDVLSSAMAAAFLLEAGERALVLGGPGIIEELNARGVVTVTPGAGREIGLVDAVVVGLDPTFDFASLAAAATALHAGARLIGTNDDPTFPTPAGVLPGAGSVLAAVARAGEVTPTIAGKPYSPTVDLVHERIGEVEIVVGDRASTDTARSIPSLMSRRPISSLSSRASLAEAVAAVLARASSVHGTCCMSACYCKQTGIMRACQTRRRSRSRDTLTPGRNSPR